MLNVGQYLSRVYLTSFKHTSLGFLDQPKVSNRKLIASWLLLRCRYVNGLVTYGFFAFVGCVTI